MVSQLLHDPPKWDGTNEEYEYALKWAAGSLYGAGTESVRSSPSVMILGNRLRGLYRFDDTLVAGRGVTGAADWAVEPPLAG